MLQVSPYQVGVFVRFKEEAKDDEERQLDQEKGELAPSKIAEVDHERQKIRLWYFSHRDPPGYEDRLLGSWIPWCDWEIVE